MRTRRSPRNQERLWRELGRERSPVDPNATWKCLIESLKDLQLCPQNGDTRAHAVDCLEVLATWLRRGGFPPKVEE
jgi:hypothetical protein